jgi:hypothetical protein
MKTWFTSLNGAITLSFAALLIELFRGFLDFALIYPKQFKGMELIAAVFYTIVFGIWAASLIAARGNSRVGLMAAFGVGLLFWLGLDWTTTLPIICPNGCETIWFNIAAGVGLVVGALALVALGLQIWRKPAVSTRMMKEQ